MSEGKFYSILETSSDSDETCDALTSSSCSSSRFLIQSVDNNDNLMIFDDNTRNRDTINCVSLL